MARGLPWEEVMCLLLHARHRERITGLEAEGARLASLPLADPALQQRALTAVGHRINHELDRFHRVLPGPVGGMSNAGGEGDDQ